MKTQQPTKQALRIKAKKLSQLKKIGGVLVTEKQLLTWYGGKRVTRANLSLFRADYAKTYKHEFLNVTKIVGGQFCICKIGNIKGIQ